MLKSKTVKTTVVEKHKYNDSTGIKLDPTLLLKLLEFAHEEAKSDVQLHSIVARATALAHHGECLYMEHYPKLIDETITVKEEVPEESEPVATLPVE